MDEKSGFSMYQPRTLENFIIKSAQQFPALLLTGARQVGKTTCMRHLAANERTYVSLDDPLVLSLAKEDPALFMQRFPPPVLIDEIQYAPELLPYIKMEVDRERKPGSFWVTGSQQFHLMKNVSETLAGRIGIVHLLGLSRKEMLGRGYDIKPFLPDPEIINERLENEDKLSLNILYQYIWRGSFPEVALHNELDCNLFYSSYVQTYIQRDIRDLAKVGDEMSFLRFLLPLQRQAGDAAQFLLQPHPHHPAAAA
ncbi:MAG: AAA family ATPase, partial [Desulfovermiculus sp.]